MNDALEELKRVDHLIYVSLKYTRTVDVIINILNRMVDAYRYMIAALIDFAGEKITHEPESAIERAELVQQMYGVDELCTDNMGLYKLLRKLLRARHIVRENEYRRHVTMKTFIEGREEIVNIDIITNYYLFQRDFILHVKGIVDGRVSIELKDQETAHPDPPAWMSEPKVEEEPPQEQTVVTKRTPPTKTTVKIRPVGAPPRKRSPRPKKYKIQIPKSKNSITLPLEYDPALRKEMQKEAERRAKEAREKELKALKAKEKRAERKAEKAKKVRKVKKKVKKKTVKKAKKKTKVRKTKKTKVTIKKVKKKKKVTIKKAKKKPAKKSPKKKSIMSRMLRLTKKVKRKK